MNRTTIMLPGDLKHRAEEYAHKLGISFGELVRKSLLVALGQKESSRKQDPLFSDKATFKGETPRDLAKNHDDYLYGAR